MAVQRDLTPSAAIGGLLLSDDFPAIDRALLRRLDGSEGVAPPPLAAEGLAPSNAHADVSAILEAIQFAASSMNATAERVEQLETHSQAFEAANRELEAQNRQLGLQLGEAIQARDATTASLEAEKERSQQLESLAAHHIARAKALEQELAVARADLEKVAELVRTCFETPE